MPDWLSLSVATSLLLSLLTIAGFILYSGLLTDITILTGFPPIKKIIFAYKFKKGPYKNCGQLFKESHSIGPKLSCLAVFYDDPKKVNHYTTIHNTLRTTIGQWQFPLPVFLHFKKYFRFKVRQISLFKLGYVVDR